MEHALRHYLREDVAREISRFCSGRWVALECRSSGGGRIFYRYWPDGRPLTISEPADLKRLINRFGNRVPRTIYGSANVYRRLERKEDVSSEDNILMSTPSWDVDGSLEEVDLIKEAAGILVDTLRGEGVEKSIYLVWSGRGVHVHLNEKALSGEIWKMGPLRISFAIAEYVLTRARDELERVCGRSRSSDRRIKIENLMDVQRVFTAPLSLHRELDLVAVTIKPDELENFDLDWARMDGFRYWSDWDLFEEGEGDELALRALAEIRSESRTMIGGEEVEERAAPAARAGQVGRFQVMGLLQAARYYVLRGDLELAKSFGLNRAIFYAWAKKRGVSARRPGGGSRSGQPAEREEIEEKVGDEIAYRSPRGYFMIGGQIQRPVDFDRMIAARFGSSFEKFWIAAVEYVKGFPEDVLRSQRDFYEKVYLPVRDNPGKILERSGRGQEASNLDESPDAA
ncbi:MAG: hypothetical protein QXO04_00990 [Nitrososphaerota archaeon]